MNKNNDIAEIIEGIKINLLKPMKEEICKENSKNIKELSEYITTKITTMNESISSIKRINSFRWIILFSSLINFALIVWIIYLLFNK